MFLHTARCARHSIAITICGQTMHTSSSMLQNTASKLPAPSLALCDYPETSQGLELLGAELNGKTYLDLPQRGPFPSRRHFDEYDLSVTTFGAKTSLQAVLRVYKNLNCGAQNLTKQQVHNKSGCTAVWHNHGMLQGHWSPGLPAAAVH